MPLTKPCCGTAIVQFFCSLFVNLLCRKPEIESLGFTCNWLVLVGRLAWTSATCTYFLVAEKFTTAKQKAGTLYQIFRETQLSFGCSVGLAQLKETPTYSRFAVTPIKLTTMHKWASHTYMHLLPCLSRWQVRTLRAHPKQALSTARQQGRGVLEPLYTTTSASSSWSRPRKYLQRLLVPLAFATTKSALYSVGSPAHPKMLAAVANRWTDTESKGAFFLRHGEGKRRRGLPSTSACSTCSSWKWNFQRGRAGHRGGARVSVVDCARSPYGESTFKRNRPFICGIIMVFRGGGGRGILQTPKLVIATRSRWGPALAPSRWVRGHAPREILKLAMLRYAFFTILGYNFRKFRERICKVICTYVYNFYKYLKSRTGKIRKIKKKKMFNMKKIMHPTVDPATFFLDVYARMSSPLLENSKCMSLLTNRRSSAFKRPSDIVLRWSDLTNPRADFFLFFFFFFFGRHGGGGGGRAWIHYCLCIRKTYWIHEWFFSLFNWLILQISQPQQINYTEKWSVCRTERHSPSVGNTPSRFASFH